MKSQCSGDYFYGKDKLLDDAIMYVEGAYAQCVEGLLGPEPALGETEGIILRRFIYLQHLRTEAASRKAAEMMFAMQDVPGVDREPASFGEMMQNAVFLAMRQFTETMRIVDDLEICLVRNRTTIPFVTSDDPAVLTNRWHLQSRRTKGQSFGARNAGILFIMPLSPDTYCILYDHDVYALPHRSGWLDIKDRADAAALNEHQILNCAANLYFRDWNGREILAVAVSDARPQRPSQHHTLAYAALDQETEEGRRYLVTDRENLKLEEDILVHVITNRPEPLAWPSFLRYRAIRQAYSNNSRTGFIRRGCLDRGFVDGSGYSRVRI